MNETNNRQTQTLF